MIFGIEDENVIALRSAGKEAHDRSNGEQLPSDDVREELLSVGKDHTSLHAHLFAIEQLRVATIGILAANLHGIEERLPVDVVDQSFGVDVVEDFRAQEGRPDDLRGLEFASPAFLSSIVDRHAANLLEIGEVLVTNVGVVVGDVLQVVLAFFVI